MSAEDRSTEHRRKNQRWARSLKNLSGVRAAIPIFLLAGWLSVYDRTNTTAVIFGMLGCAVLLAEIADEVHNVWILLNDRKGNE